MLNMITDLFVWRGW